MIGNERNFSLSLWDHKDNFICLLKSSNSNIDGQTYNEYFSENINGEKTLSFSIPMYIFNPEAEEGHNFEKNKILWEYKDNILWQYIKNEQKIRYTEYDDILNKPIRIEEFVLKEFTEERNGEEKIANCTCESLAVYELSKVGWGISFSPEYITKYETETHEEVIYEKNENEEIINEETVEIENCPDLITLDYWLRKIFYKETNLGRVSNTTECTYLLQGLQLRDNEGYPISNNYIEITSDGKRDYERINEPQCTTSVTSEEYIKYYNPTGWYWEIQSSFENDPDKQNISILYEQPTINKYIEKLPNYYVAQSYQKHIGESDNTKELRQHPISEEDLNTWTYVTDIKKRLFTVERSNIFSIIQDLCEIFGVWAYFQYNYSIEGKIIDRKILFKTEAVNEDIKFDFSYGKNLQSCSRIINSNDLITKLIVPPIESTLVDGNLLSIQQATANPTGENYIYNFDYFYEEGLSTFSRESDLGEESDEYQINLHCGKLRDINNKIIELQKFLAPLYDKQSQLQADLIIQQGTRTGYIDNIQSIQNKVDAIPSTDTIIKSWSEDNHQYNHVGPVKTYTSAIPPTKNIKYYYLDFGREDVLCDSSLTTIENYEIKDGEIISLSEKNIELENYIPRSFIYQTWHNGEPKIDEDDISYEKEINNNEQNNEENEEEQNSTTIITCFKLFERDPSGNNIIYDYSDLGDHCFIKGIYFSKKDDRGTYSRIRYKYSPLAYYYLLIKEYWEKIIEVDRKISELNSRIIEVENKILAYDLDLKKYLRDKNELILQFEKKYKPFIREGYWEPSEYQSQMNHIEFNTSNTTAFDGFYLNSNRLGDLNLNDSLSTFSKYIDLGDITAIKIDSIKMSSKAVIAGIDTMVPRYRGHDFELYRSSVSTSEFQGTKLILGISPELVTKLDNSYNTSPELYKSLITYLPNIPDEISTTTIERKWITIDSDNNPIVNDYYIYVSNDNIITSSLEVEGIKIINIDNELSTTSEILEVYQDYSYNFESTAYDTSENPPKRKNINDWVSETSSSPINYDYSLKIDLKTTDRVNKFLDSNSHFIVKYNEETTLQYLYNDSVETSKKYAFPQIEYNISVVDLSSLNGYNYYKPKLGQKVPIWDIEMGLEGYEGFITSIGYNLEQKENTELTIATYSTKFEDIFQKLTATMTDISYNSNQLYKAANSFEVDGNIKTEVFQKSLEDNFNRINLGVDNDITIDKETGITLKDRNSDNAVKIIGNGIFLSENANDENVQWKTGITGKGINADTLVTGNIDTKQVNIWNASEGQIRFRWNEQGLFAYGDGSDLQEISGTIATSSDLDKLINYSTYVKFNEDGLQFTDGGKSALSLGWAGLNINTQDNSLVLDANNGLTLTEWKNTTTGINRLQLGKLDNGGIYGLKLKDTSGTTSFQSDSDGNLWLSKFINVGGNFNEENYKPENVNAGIIGIEDTTESKYQMGIKRDTEGNLIYSTTPIRFWAGEQDAISYIQQIGSTTTEVRNVFTSETTYNDWMSISTGSPTFARFKVDADGNLIASGIDVGGWIGSGYFLRSKNHEAILRSNGYTNELPVLAIGQSSSLTNGTDYNFRVYQDGRVVATNISIGGDESNIYGGNIAGWHITNTGIYKVIEEDGIEYTTGIYSVAGSSTTDIAIQIGPTEDPNFKISENGAVVASDITITGKNNSSYWIIDSNEFQVSKFGEIGAGIIEDEDKGIISNTSLSTFDYNNYGFSVSDQGNIRFRGNISAFYEDNWYDGLDNVVLTIGEKTIRFVQGLAVSIN